MGRWIYDWEVRYYGTGGFLNRTTVRAKDRADALRKVRESARIIEVYSCRRIDRW